jgi:hypothetical protein
LLRSIWSSRLLQIEFVQALRLRRFRSVKPADLHGSLVSVALVATFVVSLISIRRCSSIAGLPVWRTFVCLSRRQVVSWAVLVGEPANFSRGAPGHIMKEPPPKVPTKSSWDRFSCAFACTFR